MAGYIFSLDNIEALHEVVNKGIYSTILSHPKNNNWIIHHEGTFADYISMQTGDNVYFFIKRKIYGIGVIIDISDNCKYLNYPEATLPTIQKYSNIKNLMIMNASKDNIFNRCICIFKPSPYFFKNGIDMDDVLSSKPAFFRMLRAFWKLSFVKVDDDENKALSDIILKRNEESLYSKSNIFSFTTSQHDRISKMITQKYHLSSKNILSSCSNGDIIRHEMAIEAGIIDTLTNDCSIFGKWDYISHQVIASPFKPIDYMDRMDIFGYRYIKGFKTISKYLVIEIKKDTTDISAVDQIMKYVDWINQEYAYGDYSMIEAYIVAHKIPNDVIKHKNAVCIRNFTKGRRPTISETWKNVTLVQYSYNQDTSKLDFEIIE